MVSVVANTFFLSLFLKKYQKISEVVIFIPLLQGRSDALIYPPCPGEQDI